MASSIPVPRSRRAIRAVRTTATAKVKTRVRVRHRKCLVVGVLLLFNTLAAGADTVYLASRDFLRQTFEKVPPPAVLWLDGATQTQLRAVLGHRYPQARLRYWRTGDKTVWVLNEIGKDYPITAGFVVAGKHIARAQVLIYRETRGAEVHLPAFLQQFVGARLAGDRLSKHIDGITGATLSVGAMRRMAQAALVLNRLAR